VYASPSFPVHLNRKKTIHDIPSNAKAVQFFLQSSDCTASLEKKKRKEVLSNPLNEIDIGGNPKCKEEILDGNAHTS
jgi:hypothetical protein